jgi:tRNA (guanine10-N2)-methyltransferase
MPSYLFYFADAHNEFRIPELHSIAELYEFQMGLPKNPDDRDPTRPCMVIALEEEGHAQILANRCILIKHVPYLDYYSLI